MQNCPDPSPWGGPDLSGSGDPSLGGLSGLGVPGGGLDLSNILGSGGPYGFGSAVGPGGISTPNDAEKTAGANLKTAAQIQIAAGVAIALGGITLSAAGAASVGRRRAGTALPAPTAVAYAKRTEAIRSRSGSREEAVNGISGTI